MKNLLVTFVTLTLLSGIAAGCSTDQPTSPSATPAASSPSSIPPTPISGSTTLTSDETAGTWRLESIQPVDQPETTVPDGAPYTLTVADGRVSARADCNMCGGAGSFTDQGLTVAQHLACTRAYCGLNSLEQPYMAILTGDSNVRVDGDQLTLTSPRGTLRFRR